jgi:hypothetical protein
MALQDALGDATSVAYALQHLLHAGKLETGALRRARSRRAGVSRFATVGRPNAPEGMSEQF